MIEPLADIADGHPFPEEVHPACLDAEYRFNAATGSASEWESRAFAAGWLAAVNYFGLQRVGDKRTAKAASRSLSRVRA